MSGIWVKVFPDDGGGPIGPAVVSGQSGGTVQSGVNIDGKTYDIYTFTDDTNDSMSITLETGGAARVLLVGGGGSGGSYPTASYPGGGGGAGEMFEADVALPAGELPVVVGSGGGLRAENWANNIWALEGGKASFVGGVAACGGGIGGGYKGYAMQGGDGGSGGGAGGGNSVGVPLYGGVIGRPSGGNIGGINSNNSPKESAGGGGAGSPGVGGAGTYNNVGGDGRESLITGVSQIFAAGGGGWQSAGGSGIGGAGMYLNGEGDVWASPPAPNTGSGGGGGASQEVEAGSAGIVIVRVEV